LDYPTGIGLPQVNYLRANNLLRQYGLMNVWGGSGVPVRNGPFAEGSWNINMYGYRGPNGEGILVPVNRGLERELGEDRNGSVLPTNAEIRAAVRNPNVLYNTQPWDRNSQNSFRNDLEGWAATDGRPKLHNLVHVFVGGDMGASTSPNDPVFFLIIVTLTKFGELGKNSIIALHIFLMQMLQISSCIIDSMIH
jgi:tyrosinase-like protein